MSDVEILPIGTKVRKISRKPFLSGFKVNTVSGYTKHPVTGNDCYIFSEDSSYVECCVCKKIETDIL